jgi:hypothetical protein
MHSVLESAYDRADWRGFVGLFERGANIVARFLVSGATGAHPEIESVVNDFKFASHYYRGADPRTNREPCFIAAAKFRGKKSLRTRARSSASGSALELVGSPCCHPICDPEPQWPVTQRGVPRRKC